MTPTSYCWSCGSLRVVLKLWLQQIHFRNDFNLDSHRCKQDTTFRTKVTCTKRLRSFRMHRRFQLVVFMLVWCFLSVVWFIYTVHCTFRRPSSHATFSVATLTRNCTLSGSLPRTWWSFLLSIWLKQSPHCLDMCWSIPARCSTIRKLSPCSCLYSGFTLSTERCSTQPPGIDLASQWNCDVLQVGW